MFDAKIRCLKFDKSSISVFCLVHVSSLNEHPRNKWIGCIPLTSQIVKFMVDIFQLHVISPNKRSLLYPFEFHGFP